MEYNFYEIGNRIADERRLRGWSQNDIIDMLANKNNEGESLGVRIGRNTLSNIENGLQSSDNFSLKLLSALADLFECEIGYLLCEDGYEVKTRRNTDIYQATGLNDKAIKTLTDLKNTYDFNKTLDILNFIMSDTTLFAHFLGYIRDYIEPSFQIPLHPELQEGNRNVKFVKNIDIESKTPVITNDENCIYIGRENGEYNGEKLYDPKAIPVSELSTLNLLRIQEILKEWKDNYNKQNKP